MIKIPNRTAALINDTVDDVLYIQRPMSNNFSLALTWQRCHARMQNTSSSFYTTVIVNNSRQ